MIAVVTVLLAFPLGFRMRSWFAASVIYALAYLWAFTYQTLYLMLDSMDGGSAPAFEASEFPLAYGLVTLAIFGVGFGLVALGHRVAAGRSWRATRIAAHEA
jgi:hypothetical protein